MNAKNTGGPAFPNFSKNHHTDPRPQDGMSLRDYFAGIALGRLMELSSPDGHEDAELTAGWAYAYADAMLRARAV